MGSNRVIRAEASTTIRRPVADVFSWLTEPALLPQWVTGLVASRPDGQARRCAWVRGRSRRSPYVARTVTMKSEIVELEDCRVIASRIETPDGPLLSRFVLDDLGDACSLTHTLTAEFE